MKKRILLFILAVAMPIGSIFAQMTYNHWSIQAKGGVNTIKGLYIGNDPWSRTINAEYGGAIEYTFTPLIGVGIEYVYLKNNHSDLDFTSNVNQATVFGSLNLSNLTIPYRTGFWKSLNTYFNFGTGFCFGDYNTDAVGITPTSDNVMNLAAVFSLNFEYNVGKALSIGIEPQYFANSNSKYNRVPFQSSENGFYTLNLNVRYKIGGSRMHIRNQNYVDYQLDQIENTEHYKKQQAAIKAEMEQLVVNHAKSEVLLIDSLYKETQKADSAIIKLINVAKDSVKTDTLKAVQTVQVTKPIQVVEQPEQKIPLVEPIVDQPTDISTKPVSMRKETYSNTPYCHKLLKQYSVVVGSFSNKENAERLSSKLKNDGHEGIVVQNEQGMYRVIPFTSSSIDATVSQVKKMRTLYPDAWIAICVMKE